jgi:glycoprotein endo-alpha-1,2-mannosidase
MTCSFAAHAAFYLWYGTPEYDGRWLHWDHPTLPHWTVQMNERFPPGRPFQPPDAPHSPYYPSRGLYSSRDTAVLREQMLEIAAAGIGSVMLSWWGQAGKEVQRDSQGVSTDELVPAVLDAAAAAGVGISWHIEPYGGRTPSSVLDDLRYLHAQYGAHPAVWRQPAADGQSKPLVFLCPSLYGPRTLLIPACLFPPHAYDAPPPSPLALSLSLACSQTTSAPSTRAAPLPSSAPRARHGRA